MTWRRTDRDGAVAHPFDRILVLIEQPKVPRHYHLRHSLQRSCNCHHANDPENSPRPRPASAPLLNQHKFNTPLKHTHDGAAHTAQRVPGR